MIPCQDSPSVKVTYSASVKSVLPVVMSALQTGTDEADKDGLKTYHFSQKTTIPSYLIAIAVGNLVGREIGPRSTVWCEPEMIESAAWEFADTESFVATGEELLTPYEWGRYDLLVLPPSFPYGGMEVNRYTVYLCVRSIYHVFTLKIIESLSYICYTYLVSW